MLQPSDFISVRDSAPFAGEFPKVVHALHSKTVAGKTAIVADTARQGDPDYEKVLTGWMLEQGYILKEPA